MNTRTLFSLDAPSALAASSPPRLIRTSLPGFARWETQIPVHVKCFDALHSNAEPTTTFTPRGEGPLFIPPPAVYPVDFRSSDGFGNNINNLGETGQPDLRTTTNAYGDGIGSPAGADRLSARGH